MSRLESLGRSVAPKTADSIGDSMTAPVRWMSDAMSAEGDLVGFLVQDGACVYWREYHAGTSDDS